MFTHQESTTHPQHTHVPSLDSRSRAWLRTGGRFERARGIPVHVAKAALARGSLYYAFLDSVSDQQTFSHCAVAQDYLEAWNALPRTRSTCMCS